MKEPPPDAFKSRSADMRGAGILLPKYLFNVCSLVLIVVGVPTFSISEERGRAAHVLSFSLKTLGSEIRPYDNNAENEGYRPDHKHP